MIIRIYKIWLVLTLVLLGTNLSFPVYSQSDASKQITPQNRTDLMGLISEWKATLDFLEKAKIAKEMQTILGVKRDGLIGNQTLAAIKSSGIYAKIPKPTKSEISITRMIIEASEGKVPKERLSKISSGSKQFKDLREQIKSGILTVSQGEKKMSAIINSIIPTKATSILQNDQKEINSLNTFSNSKSKKCLGCVDGQNADGSKINIQADYPKQKNTENKNVFHVKKDNKKSEVLRTNSINKDLKIQPENVAKKESKNTKKMTKKKKKK